MKLCSLALVIMTLVPAISVHAATVITQTVGQVGEHVVTSREVQISSVIEHILYPTKDDAKDLYQVQLGTADFKNAVTATLLETMVAEEATNFSVSSLNDTELNQVLGKVDKTVAGNSYWSRLDVSPLELRTLISRKLVSKNFLRFKTSSMAGIISDQEAQKYFEKNRTKFGTMPFSNFKESIKIYLAKQQLEDRLRSWFELIKHKYKVRNFLAS